MKSVSKIVILVFACILSSCDKWLDVLSNEEILEEDAFSSYTGYRLALIGAYRDISDPKLYGQELTWGFLSAIGRNYYLSQSNMPYGYWMALDKSNYENKNYTCIYYIPEHLIFFNL